MTTTTTSGDLLPTTRVQLNFTVGELAACTGKIPLIKLFRTSGVIVPPDGATGAIGMDLKAGKDLSDMLGNILKPGGRDPAEVLRERDLSTEIDRLLNRIKTLEASHDTLTRELDQAEDMNRDLKAVLRKVL